MADAVYEEQEPAADVYSYSDASRVDEDPSATTRGVRLDYLGSKATDQLMKQGYRKEDIAVERYLNLRYDGTDTAVMIKDPTPLSSLQTNVGSSHLPYADAFRSHYRREFGFVLDGRDILIDDYRVRAVVPGIVPPKGKEVKYIGEPEVVGSARAYFENGWEDVKVFDMETMRPGNEVVGPAIIVQSISTIVVEMGCRAFMTSDGDLEISVDSDQKDVQPTINVDEEPDIMDIEEDPVQLSIFSHRFMGIAEQMGRTLQRTAISVNMKVRIDLVLLF